LHIWPGLRTIRSPDSGSTGSTVTTDPELETRRLGHPLPRQDTPSPRPGHPLPVVRTPLPLAPAARTHPRSAAPWFLTQPHQAIAPVFLPPPSLLAHRRQSGLASASYRGLAGWRGSSERRARGAPWPGPRSLPAPVSPVPGHSRLQSVRCPVTPGAVAAGVVSSSWPPPRHPDPPLAWLH